MVTGLQIDFFQLKIIGSFRLFFKSASKVLLGFDERNARAPRCNPLTVGANVTLTGSFYTHNGW